MDTGARASRGDTLLFLHGDTILPADFAAEIETTLSRDEGALGAFRFSLDISGIRARFIEACVALRCRLFKTPYGDQALFLRRQRFFELGGYGDLPFLEDYILVRRARRSGPVRVLRAAVVTSGRRWRGLGFLKTTIINQMVILGYLLGVPLTDLKKLYGVVKKG